MGSIPMVQGALLYAYKVDKLKGASKEHAEGAVFAAAVLPRVAACDSEAAKTISDNLAIDVEPMTGGFVAVKEAFESTYACLGIKCEDIGGLLLSDGEFYESAEP